MKNGGFRKWERNEEYILVEVKKELIRMKKSEND